MSVRKILKSKPVILAGAATLASKIKSRGRKKQRRAKVLSLVTGTLVIGMAIGVARWLTDPVLGESRRQKLFGKQKSDPLHSVDNGKADVKIPEPTPEPSI